MNTNPKDLQESPKESKMQGITLNWGCWGTQWGRHPPLLIVTVMGWRERSAHWTTESGAETEPERIGLLHGQPERAKGCPLHQWEGNFSQSAIRSHV